MTAVRVILFAAAVASVAAPATMRAQFPAPRDVEIRPTIGTASISGVVVDDEADPQPVRRVIVSLTAPDLRPSRGAITDDAGRFTIARLPSGRFTLTVARAGFVTSAYGAKRAGRPGTAIAIAAGQAIDVTARIWRGAAIAGVVRDEEGVPAAGIPVTATRARSSPGPLLTLTNNGAATNERGEYRIFGLEPGAYIVSAKPVSNGDGPLTAMAEADVDAAFDAIRMHSMKPPTGAVATGAADGQPLASFTYAPVFYPGTSRSAQATPVVLQAGQAAAGIDLQLERVNTATVDGEIVRLDGLQAEGGAVQVTRVAGPFDVDPGFGVSVSAGRDGHFTIPQLAPGDYELLVASSSTTSTAPPPRLNGGIVAPSKPEPTMWGRVTVSVAGADIHGLTVPVQPGVALTGQIRLEASTGDRTPLPDVSTWRVLLSTPADRAQKFGTPNRSMATQPGIPIAADGTFVVTDVAPVAHVLLITSRDITSTSWRPVSAMLNGRDLLDRPFELSAADDGSSVVVTLTTRHSVVSGMLQTATGQAASDVFVIAFAVDSAYWGAGARRVQAVRPGVDGRYSIPDLPPGDYLLAAVTDVEPDEWQDPAFLATLVPGAVKISVGQGDTAAPTLRIGG